MAFNVIDTLRAFRTLALTGDFSATIGNRLYIASVPPNTAEPYGLIDVISVVPWDTFDKEGFFLRIQVSLLVSDASGAIGASTLASNLRDNVSRGDLTVSGLDITGITRESERGPFRDDKLWRADCDYIVRALESS